LCHSLACQRSAQCEGVEAYLIRDINAQPDSGGSYPTWLNAVEHQVFFVAHDGVDRWPGIWVSEGSRDWTHRIAGLSPDTRFFSVAAIGSTVLFKAFGPDRSYGLWRWDQEAWGEATFVSSSTPDDTGGPQPSFIVKDGVAYFIHRSPGDCLPALWRTDGTSEETTTVVHRLAPSCDGQICSPAPFQKLEGKLYFFACDFDGTDCQSVITSRSCGLWMSNGTPGDAALVKDLGLREGPMAFASTEARLFFWTKRGDDGAGGGLWVSDGTAQGTNQILDASALDQGWFDRGRGFAVANGRAYFTYWISREGGSQAEAWVSDGSSAGTQPFRRALGLPDDVLPGLPAWARGRLFFIAESHDEEHQGLSYSLWTSDSSGGAASKIVWIDYSSGIYRPPVYSVGPWLVFSIPGSGTWISDGSPEGTQPIPSCGSLEDGGLPVLLQDNLLLLAGNAGSEPATGCELWGIRFPRFRRGDANADSVLDLSDAVSTLGFLFTGDAAPPCHSAADANDSGAIDLSDAVYTLGYLFLGTAPPPVPFPDCGVDPISDVLTCDDDPGC